MRTAVSWVRANTRAIYLFKHFFGAHLVYSALALLLLVAASLLGCLLMECFWSPSLQGPAGRQPLVGDAGLHAPSLSSAAPQRGSRS